MEDDTRTEIRRLLKRGLHHYGFGDLEQAIACWEEVRKRDPRNQAAADYLETAYHEKSEGGEPRAARRRRALESSGSEDTQPTYSSLGTASRALGDADDTPRSAPEVAKGEGGGSATEGRIAAALAAYRAGDMERAWDELQAAARGEPERLDVQGYLQLVRSARAKRWAQEIGDRNRVLQLRRTMAEVMGLDLRPEEGFLLSQIDGRLTIEELISVSNADRVRTLEMIARFLRDDIVG